GREHSVLIHGPSRCTGVSRPAVCRAWKPALLNGRHSIQPEAEKASVFFWVSVVRLEEFPNISPVDRKQRGYPPVQPPPSAVDYRPKSSLGTGNHKETRSDDA